MKKKRWVFVIVLVCLWSNAMADTYILHTPTAEQIQKDEAIQIALEFIKSMTGVELTGLYRVENGRRIRGEVETYFGPGYQWWADTQDDCWVLSLRNETSIHRPLVLVHGTTGEVSYWECSDPDTGILYINMKPQGSQLLFEEAVSLAEEQVLEVFPLLGNVEAVLGGAFGLATNWNSAFKQFAKVPAWCVSLRYTYLDRNYVCSFIIDASSKEIYDQQIYVDPLATS